MDKEPAVAMKVLLRKDVPTLGTSGEIVSVSVGYGRNYLLPRRLALEVTPANVQKLEAEKKRRAARELQKVEEFKAFADRIAAVDVTLRERVSQGDNLYGAVTAREIVTILADEGIQIDASMVEMPEPIKTLGVHRVKIRLHPQVVAELKTWVVELKEADVRGQGEKA
jgi:large subunit ribosomal protein L9